jgi:hypothetical protein
MSFLYRGKQQTIGAEKLQEMNSWVISHTVAIECIRTEIVGNQDRRLQSALLYNLFISTLINIKTKMQKFLSTNIKIQHQISARL